MAETTWRFEVDGVPHTLTLQHGWWSSRRVLTLDEELILATRSPYFMDAGSEDTVEVGEGHLAVVQITVEGTHFEYRLHLDGKVVDPLPTGRNGRSKLKRERIGSWWHWGAVGAALLAFLGLVSFFSGDPAASYRVEDGGTVHSCGTGGKEWHCQLSYRFQGERYTVPLSSSYEVSDGDTPAVFVDPERPARFQLFHSGPTSRSWGIRVILVALAGLGLYGGRMLLRGPAASTTDVPATGGHTAPTQSEEEIRLRFPATLRLLAGAALVGGPLAVAASFAFDSELLVPSALFTVLAAWPAHYGLFTRVETDCEGIVLVHGLSERKILWNEIGSCQVHSDPFGAGAVCKQVWIFLWDYDPSDPFRQGLRGDDRRERPAWDCLPNSLQWSYGGRRRIPEPSEVAARLEALRELRAASQGHPRPVTYRRSSLIGPRGTGFMLLLSVVSTVAAFVMGYGAAAATGVCSMLMLLHAWARARRTHEGDGTPTSLKDQRTFRPPVGNGRPHDSDQSR
jgi:hypothetical protein